MGKRRVRGRKTVAFSLSFFLGLVSAWARDLISCGIIISDLTLRFMDRLVL